MTFFTQRASEQAQTPPTSAPSAFLPLETLETAPELRLSFAELSENPPAELSVPRVGADADEGAGDDIVTTAPMRAQLRLMVALISEMLGFRGTAKMAATLRSRLRDLYSQEKHAMTDWAKRALRSCPEWQARVLGDLGGEAGMARWRARLMKSYEVEPEDDYAWLDDDPEDWPVPDLLPARPKRKSTDKISARFKTDRDGLFRWASIKLGRRVSAPREPAPQDWHDDSAGGYRFAFADKAARKTFADPWPIELLPSDVSGEAEEEEYVEGGVDPLSLWDALQAEHHYWHGRITDVIAAARQRRLNKSSPLLLVPP